MRRALSLIFSLLLLAGSLTGCSAQHWRYEELSFTLPSDFQNRSAEGYAADFDFLFENGAVALAGIRETKHSLSGFGDIDAAAYTQLVIQYNGLTCHPVQKGDLLCFRYEAVSGGIPMTYLCAVYEAENSFWQVQAYCATADLPAQEQTMWDLITSMKTT
jgi:hypothetical protein